jgi:hypothetical protein
MDVLSDTLKVVRLSGAVFLRAKLPSPWAVASATASELAEYLRLPSTSSRGEAAGSRSPAPRLSY